nr:GntR family transcriptional regulator [Cellulomonas sp. IC4_254]
MDVYRQIKAEITSGTYRTGDFLPIESELMAQYDVSRTTIRKAVALLRTDGYVDSRQGRGTEVTASPRRADSYAFTSLVGRTAVETRAVSGSPSSVVAQAATIETVRAPEDVALALGLEPGALVHRVQRIKLMDDEPVAHIASYLDAAAFPDLAEQSGRIFYLYDFLAKRYGTRFARSQSRVSAVTADFIESRVLDIPVGFPLLLHTRVTESPSGPIEYAESFERSDRLGTFITISPDGDQRDASLDLVM